jgi:hypothetical protein
VAFDFIHLCDARVPDFINPEHTEVLISA